MLAVAWPLGLVGNVRYARESLEAVHGSWTFGGFCPLLLLDGADFFTRPPCAYYYSGQKDGWQPKQSFHTLPIIPYFALARTEKVWLRFECHLQCCKVAVSEI